MQLEQGGGTPHGVTDIMYVSGIEDVTENPIMFGILAGTGASLLYRILISKENSISIGLLLGGLAIAYKSR